MEIRRDFYLDKLIKRKNNGLIKVITECMDSIPYALYLY